MSYPDTYENLLGLMKKLGTHIPDTQQAFMELHHAGSKDGALSGKVKELIALGIAITVRCDGCIAFHVHDALKAGATAEEITETIGVAIVMGGGPSMVYGCEALAALEQFQEELVAE